jgi:hypothetical protein
MKRFEMIIIRVKNKSEKLYYISIYLLLIGNLTSI